MLHLTPFRESWKKKSKNRELQRHFWGKNPDF